VNNRKVCGLMGLALRARQAEAGTDACRILIRSGKCGVLLMDGNAGPNTRKKAKELCERTQTPLLVLPGGMIESATGRCNMLLGIRQGGFADEILRTAQEETGNRFVVPDQE